MMLRKTKKRAVLIWIIDAKSMCRHAAKNSF